jgi:putative ABC transport system permease protein
VLRATLAILGIAARNLLAAPRRALFLGGALFGVTFLFVLLLALAAGVEDSLIRAATSVSSGHLNIGGFYKSSPRSAQPIVSDIGKLKEEARAALPDAVRVIDRVRGFGKVISEAGSIQTGINGVDLTEESVFMEILVRAPAKDYQDNPADPELTKGRIEDLDKPDTILLFASQAKRLHVDIGDQVTLRTETSRRQVNTADVTVVAIARDIGLLSSFAAFVPKKTVQTLYRFKPDVSGAVQIYLKDIDDTEAAVATLRAALEKNGHVLMAREAQPFFMKMLRSVPNEDWTGTRLDVTSWQDEASFLTQIISGLRAVSFFLILVLAIVIVVGITNAMTIAVRERTQEIGTLRALGMQRRTVLGMFVAEMLILGGIATLLGATFGAGLCALVDLADVRIDLAAVRVILLSDTLHLVPRWADAALAVFALTLVSTLAALPPALRAARVQPITAMQSAG